jgi:hypothetical protein
MTNILIFVTSFSLIVFAKGAQVIPFLNNFPDTLNTTTLVEKCALAIQQIQTPPAGILEICHGSAKSSVYDSWTKLCSTECGIFYLI